MNVKFIVCFYLNLGSYLWVYFGLKMLFFYDVTPKYNWHKCMQSEGIDYFLKDEYMIDGELDISKNLFQT